MSTHTSSPSDQSPFSLLARDDSPASCSECNDNVIETIDGAECTSIIRGGLTAEHLDTISARNWKSVLNWIAFHPDEVSTFVDREGHTSLHHACLFRAPLDVIEAMIFAASELTTFLNDDGELPLHWAVRLALSLNVLEILLEANPKSGFVMDNKGVSPLAILWDRHEASLMDSCRVYGMDGVLSRLAWRRIMMLVDAYVEDGDTDCYPLHAIVQTPCDESFLTFALLFFRHEINERDAKGFTPLQLACRSPISSTSLSTVLDCYPQGACVSDARGRLPLQLVIASGKKWDEGVEIIFLANPSAVGNRDLTTGLYPFMDAATSPTVCLSTIYSLLRASPELVKSG